MDRLLITGGVPLRGSIEISGAKNAALPLMAACLLTDQPLELENVPDLVDVASMWRLMQVLGVEARHIAGAPGRLALHCPQVMNTTAPYDLVRKMRASVLVLGPLLARAGEARVSLPGGCAIGTRPIDLHLDGLERMGASIELVDGYAHARAPQGLKGAKIRFPQPSVGATENLMMAATLAKGETVISEAACEPEIVDLAKLSQRHGGEDRGRGNGGGPDPRRAEPVRDAAPHPAGPHRVRHLCHGRGDHRRTCRAEARPARAAGRGPREAGRGRCRAGGDGRRLHRRVREWRALGVDVMTRPFPGFATDLQAQFMTLMCLARGAAMITETIFENRFMHVPELLRMGAQVTVHGGSALVRGVRELKAAPVMATDLRASVSLVIAALAANGRTELNRIYHLDRGYERLEEKLTAVGAQIERMP